MSRRTRSTAFKTARSTASTANPSNSYKSRMLRAVAIAAALPFMGAPKAAPPAVEYRLSAGPEGIAVEMRLRGEADGETRLQVPSGLTSDLAVSGGKAQAVDATHRAVRHRPGAKLMVRYR